MLVRWKAVRSWGDFYWVVEYLGATGIVYWVKSRRGWDEKIVLMD